MKSCTFFGHRHIYTGIEDALTTSIVRLIEDGVNMFYVGSHGDFDQTVIHVLKSLKHKYPHISYYVVLAYPPVSKNKFSVAFTESTLYPEVLETVPQKYALIKRNEWMIDKSDYVIVYVKNNFGNSAKFKEFSEKKNKTVINIAHFVD